MFRIASLLATLAVFATAHAGEAQKKIYAQELVDRAAAAHPQVIAIEMHVTPPKSAANIVIAARNGHLGEKADQEDLDVIASGKVSAALNKAGDRYEVNQRLLDASRRTVGSLGIAFAYHRGDDQAALRKQAEEIRDRIARRISHLANLMEDTPVDASIPTSSFAQKLVDDMLDANKDLVIVAVHAPAPSNAKYPIIASNIGRIGKAADEDDMSVITTGEPRLEVNDSGDRFESEGVLRDAGGKVIGAVGIVFPYKKGDDQQALHRRAETLRGSMAARITGVDRLLQPAG
ncbi:MAG: hypothetical protein J0I77_10650 [Rudaea sp.]|uniref:hypothetical protein n=1 Tax=unclassified Rudaea TaxID=2627037 RepID=UPI0010F46EC6|nr:MULTISPECIES: hypothetical protein [unclassified Rudaea]MBN8886171.1 hypothetical protein [Rudaea sp.]MBR0345205.1 hypothetical protein [Rudaea sp.]